MRLKLFIVSIVLILWIISAYRDDFIILLPLCEHDINLLCKLSNKIVNCFIVLKFKEIPDQSLALVQWPGLAGNNPEEPAPTT
jgi:hypothetical protein